LRAARLCFSSSAADFPSALPVLLPSHAVLVRRPRRQRPVLPGDAAFRGRRCAPSPSPAPGPAAADSRRRWCAATADGAPFADGL